MYIRIPPRSRQTNSCLPGISVNKSCCKNTAFCHCNMRRLIAAIHVMFQYSHAAAERNKFDKKAAIVGWEPGFPLQRRWLQFSFNFPEDRTGVVCQYLVVAFGIFRSILFIFYGWGIVRRKSICSLLEIPEVHFSMPDGVPNHPPVWNDFFVVDFFVVNSNVRGYLKESHP